MNDLRDEPFSMPVLCDLALDLAGDAQQNLIMLPGLDSRHQVGDGVRLVSGRRIIADQLEPPPAFALFRARRTVRRPQRGGPWTVMDEGAGNVGDAGRGGLGHG